MAAPARAVDVTPPAITLSVFGTEGDNGWYVTNVLVNWETSDPESGVQSEVGCGPTSLTADTASTRLKCTATNTVGSRPRLRRPIIRLDKTAPSAVANADRTADAGGFYNHQVSVSWTGTDATSGIASCTSTPYAGPDGTGISLTGTCKDNAGNISAAVPFVFNYDSTAARADRRHRQSRRCRRAACVAGVGGVADHGHAQLGHRARGAERCRLRRHGQPGSPTPGSTNGTRYTYLVQAFDAAGNATSDAVEVTPNAAASTEHLLSPGFQAKLTRAPMLRWREVRRASYYNVQLFRKGKKILSAWPTKPHYQLRKVWTYRGRRHRLMPGTYWWYIWAGYGHRSEHRYGKLLGRRSFTVA